MILTALYTSNRVNIHFRFPHVDTSRDTECGMVALPPNVIGDAQTSTFAWDTLTSLVDVGGRMAGQDGERRGAQVMKAAFREAGLRSPTIEEFEIPGWWRASSSLTIDTPHERTHTGTHDVISLPGSPSGSVTAPLVDVDAGGYDSFEIAGDTLEGAIVMASSETPETADRWIHRMEKYSNAVNGGAIGFIFRNHIDGSLPPTGEVGYNNRPGAIPAIGVSAEVGKRLARYAETDSATVTLTTECRNEPAYSRNVEAQLGPESGDAVLLTAHIDSHDISDGAADNAAGSAIVAEVGRLLTAVESDLKRPVRFITFGAEEIGLRGAYQWVETHDLSDVSCVINIDGAGTSRNLRVYTNGFCSLQRLFTDVTDSFDAPLSVNQTISPHGDQWAFVQEGVPAVMAGSTSDASGRGWGHTHADTIDKLDSRDIRDLATLVADAVYRVAVTDCEVPHKPRDTVRQQIDDGYVTELKTGGGGRTKSNIRLGRPPCVNSYQI